LGSSKEQHTFQMSSFRLTITRAARIDIENSAEWYSFQKDDLEKD